MGWNYRIMLHTGNLPTGGVEKSLAIHGVYYDDSGNLEGWTESPDYIAGESIEDIKENLELMKRALDRPILDYETGKEVKDAP